jgi:hypothetical protein
MSDDCALILISLLAVIALGAAWLGYYGYVPARVGYGVGAGACGLLAVVIWLLLRS